MTNAWEKRRRLSGWSGGYIEWIEGGTVFLSVVFSWLLPKALKQARHYKFMGYDVRVGGPAVDLNPGYFGGFAQEGGHIRGVLQRHNPNATRSTIGCVNRCKFCGAWRIEGRLKKLPDSEWPLLPLECSNNLLAVDDDFFDHVIDRYLDSDVDNIDFNQGLDARRLTEHHAKRFVELHRAKKLKCVRLAWDHKDVEGDFRAAHKMLRSAGMPKNMISVYVLIGFHDTPDDALYRLSEVWALGAWPYAMRYQPLDAKKRNEFVGKHWTDQELKRYCSYWNNLRHLSGVPFDEYKR